MASNSRTTRRSDLNTQPRNAGKPFTERAVNFLTTRAGKQSASSIARQLGRTEKSVRRKAEKLGLSLRLAA